ncbi:LysR family transcriptional regulator [Cupriavidus pauculus]|uniref:LysR family transcriptional regulator n=2 Tax=Cupriavidus TaxID=106589 RepID=A0A5P2HED3_9BURK|nr:LysR family transcriptional regulator [Cupriavidus pauculus]
MDQLQTAPHAVTHDGTTAAHLDRDMQLAAFNAAFMELGLRFRWDMQMFEWLCGIECERTRVCRYIEEYHAHLLTAYEPAFLSQLIFDKKNDYLRAMRTGVN